LAGWSIRLESHGTVIHRVLEVVHPLPSHVVLRDRENRRRLVGRDRVVDETPRLPSLDLLWRPEIYRTIQCQR
jgi:hypothetical protein